MTTATKKPSAAELARREAQSKEAKGVAPIDIEVRGIKISVDPEALDDYDAIVAFNQNDPDPLLKIFLPDDKARTAALDSLRDDKGRLKFSDVLVFVAELSNALSPKA